jgi:cell division protein FtsW
MVLEKIRGKMADFKTLVKIMVMIMPLIIVVALNNLSTALIIFGIAVCMLFVASPKYAQFFIVGGAGAAFAVFFIVFAGYRGDRITAWLDPENAGDAGYQTMQGLYAIGSGKLFGKGLGQSLQKLGNVPEAQNDMIFSIICEELGLFGAVSVILLFVLLLWRMMVIANNAKDLYGSLIVVGIMSHIAIQAILNIGVVTATIPNTGVILPFISYGGTSLVFLMAEMGLALNVSKGIRLEAIGSKAAEQDGRMART